MHSHLNIRLIVIAFLVVDWLQWKTSNHKQPPANLTDSHTLPKGSLFPLRISSDLILRNTHAVRNSRFSLANSPLNFMLVPFFRVCGDEPGWSSHISPSSPSLVRFVHFSSFLSSSSSSSSSSFLLSLQRYILYILYTHCAPVQTHFIRSFAIVLRSMILRALQPESFRCNWNWTTNDPSLARADAAASPELDISRQDQAVNRSNRNT